MSFVAQSLWWNSTKRSLASSSCRTVAGALPHSFVLGAVQGKTHRVKSVDVMCVCVCVCRGGACTEKRILHSCFHWGLLRLTAWWRRKVVRCHICSGNVCSQAVIVRKTSTVWRLRPDLPRCTFYTWHCPWLPNAPSKLILFWLFAPEHAGFHLDCLHWNTRDFILTAPEHIGFYFDCLHRNTLKLKKKLKWTKL